MVRETGSWKFPNLLPQISPSMVPHPFRGLAFALGGAGLYVGADSVPGPSCKWSHVPPYSPWRRVL